MNVDGRPNVRTCTEPVRNGMKIKHQNAWPSLDHDFFSVIEKFSRFLPVGFYYKTLIRPRLSWHIAEPIIRRVAGLGKVELQSKPEGAYEHQYRHTDVAIVGGGPAGLSAAAEASRLGARVTLIDDNNVLGGHLLFDTQTHSGVDGYPPSEGPELARRLREADRLTGVEMIQNGTVFGLYEGNLLGITQDKRLIKLRAKRIITATGYLELPMVFRNNDLPGVFLGDALQRMIHLYGVKPGERAIVVTNRNSGLVVARDLLNAGVKVVGIIHSDSLPSENAIVQDLKVADIPIFTSYTIKEAIGKRQVKAAVIAKLDENSNFVSGSEVRLPCDLIAISVGLQPENALLHQAGCKLVYDESLCETIPTELAANIFAAGDVTGIHDLRASLLQGKMAGIEAALSLRESREDNQAKEAMKLWESYNHNLQAIKATYNGTLRIRNLVNVPNEADKKFVCICEDVKEKDLQTAIEEGFDNIETLKRYATVTMGPCQGKMCLAASIVIAAKETNTTIQKTGTTTFRPPTRPITFGALGGARHHPVKLTPVHQKHIQHGAKMMDMGIWKRPHLYTTPEEEYKAVRERVGILDASTFGKLEVQGKDAGRLLDKVYTHMFSTLKVGRTRYGVICDEDGVILDDGTVSRLAEDRFYITTSTGNFEFVEQWLSWWAAGTGMCVHITDVTAAYATLNVAGPKARDVLKKLTNVDLATNAFPYMACAKALVAGIPTILLRVGFVGEASWELHLPSEYAEYVWDTLMEAGKEFDIAPFGVEAQRILRLEKKHILVGVDTDAVSNPFESDMAWVVKFEKEDFIGKPGLLMAQGHGLRNKLIGFMMQDPVVPEDGNAIVVNGKPVGRVTSSRFSPSLGKGFGFAWVPVELAEHGTKLQIVVNDRTTTAMVVKDIFYDPEGIRLKM